MGTHPIFESDFDCLTVQNGVRLWLPLFAPFAHLPQHSLPGHFLCPDGTRRIRKKSRNYRLHAHYRRDSGCGRIFVFRLHSRHRRHSETSPGAALFLCRYFIPAFHYRILGFYFVLGLITHMTMKALNCCGYNRENYEDYWATGNYCADNNILIPPKDPTAPYEFCKDKIEAKTDAAVEKTGAIALFFSFTEMFGVWLAIRYRNQRNPAGPDPRAFE